jgi:hypothetical protein
MPDPPGQESEMTPRKAMPGRTIAVTAGLLLAAAAVAYGVARDARAASFLRLIADRPSRVTVQDTGQLVAALHGARGGDTILLAPGDYDGVKIENLSFDVPVVIRSADPARPAALKDLTLAGAGGLRFRGLEFVVNPSGPLIQFQALRSKDIEFAELYVHGSLDGDPTNDQLGILIRQSSNVTVRQSEFRQLRTGILHMNSENVVLANNFLHEIRTDGIDGVGSSSVTISNNFFTNFHFAEKDHPDAIQFWTRNATASVHDITVTGNVFLRGEGTAAQGIFFHDEVGHLPFQNVKIADNLIIGGLYNGINVDGAEGVQISGNKVVSIGGYTSWIRTFRADGVKAEHNKANKMIFQATRNLSESGNGFEGFTLDGGKKALRRWVADHADFLNGLPKASRTVFDQLGAAPKGGAPTSSDGDEDDAQPDHASPPGGRPSPRPSADRSPAAERAAT